MLPLQLTIRYRETPQHAAAAWLVPGDLGAENTVSLWVEEWLRWQLPQAEWRVAVLPGWGVLTILPAGQMPAVTPRAVPLGRLGSRWYLPLHAELIPAVTAAEIEALLTSDFAAAVFHPARGLLVVETRELRSLAEFFEAPSFCAQDWTLAQPGEALNDRLLSVQPSLLPSLTEIIQTGRDDIGSQGNNLTHLPPRPNEPGNGLIERAGRGAAKSFYQAVQGMANMLGASPPHNANQPPQREQARKQSAGNGWLQSLAQWAAQKVSGVSQQIEDMRNREIKRLMHLLETNPDEGLKYALPFSCGGEHRGLAPPSGWLGAREVNFNLNHLGGGGAADVWNLSAQHQLQLMLRYRELANRELQLGRHRRAAYIFAELIGDLQAAASALQAGEHWREAAVLYRDRLKHARSAAECLERGGLLHEAIALYETLQEHEKIGDLYLRLEQRDEALRAWTTAAEVQEGKRDYLKAARLWEEKIERPEEAANVLERSWLGGYQLRESLEQLFELFTRQAWHDRAHARIKSLRDALNTDTIALAGSEALVTVARSYPDRAIAALAEDTTRVLAGIHLPKADNATSSRLVAALQGLVPADQLLQRDGQRYLREHEAWQPTPPPLPPKHTSPKDRGPQLVREFQLPSGVLWDAVAAVGESFLAIGNQPRMLVGACGNWQGKYLCEPQHYLPTPPANTGRTALLAVDSHGHGPALAVYHPRVAGSKAWEFATNAGARRMLLLPRTEANQSHPFLLMGLAYAEHRVYQLQLNYYTGVLHVDGYALPSTHDLGQIVTTFEVGRVRSDEEEGNALLGDSPDFPVHGRAELLAIGLGRELILCWSGSPNETIPLPGVIHQIAGSAPFTRTRLAAVTDRGTQVFWIQGKDVSRPIPCGDDVPDAVACFTAGGRLVLVGRGGGEIYETTGGNLKFQSRLTTITERPLAVLPTDEPDQFAIFAPSGLVRIYRIG